MIINESTINALYELISECFKYNRRLDRNVSLLNTKFAMNNTSKLCHKEIAHMFPKLADNLGELCLERYNIDVEYGETPEAKFNHASAEDIIKMINEDIIDFQNMFIGCAIIAQKNQDLQVYTDLLELLKDYNKIVEQTILMVDKLELYGDSLSSYDAHIKEHFWIL